MCISCAIFLGPLKPPAGHCYFETGDCGYTQEKRSKKAQWLRNRGPTPTSYTGPKADHTLGVGESIYLNYACYTVCLLVLISYGLIMCISLIKPRQVYLKAANIVEICIYFTGHLHCPEDQFVRWLRLFGSSDHITDITVSLRVLHVYRGIQHVAWELGTVGDAGATGFI